MIFRKKPSFKHEWHLYSIVAILFALTFLTIQISTGTPQTLGIAFTAIIGTYLLNSENWKETAEIVHKWVIFFSVVIFIVASGLIFYFNHKESETQ